MFISFLYMFRATLCPSSGEITVPMRHSVFITLCGWLSSMQGGMKPPCRPDSHPHRVTNTKFRIDTVISPDDGHRVARNMQRKEINILRKIVHQSWLYLQDYTGMHGQRKIKLIREVRGSDLGWSTDYPHCCVAVPEGKCHDSLST
jgi:hypothetical protein